MTEHNFDPAWASPPGETIADILEEQRLSQNDFAQRIGQSAKHARDLLHGNAELTKDIAERLAKVLGGTVTFWVNRERQYRESIVRLRDQLDPEIAKQFLRELPLNDMIQMGWVQTVQDVKGKAAACLQFFGVADVDSFRESYADVLKTPFRTSPIFKNDPAAVAAWLRQGELEAAKLDCAEWNSKAFSAILAGIRELTRERDPRVFLPELQRRCAACGVAILVIKAPNGCRASGAVRILSRGRRMILLSARYLTDDHFWFTFFHEAGHLLLHDGEALLLEGTGTISDKEENEANEFSSNILIPPERRQEMLNLPFDAKAIMRFAKEIGVSRGVVVGQLQHAGKIKHGHFRNLKFSFQWD
jgi:HTH-type transcriptional regulator/antitoxin HigA